LTSAILVKHLSLELFLDNGARLLRHHLSRGNDPSRTKTLDFMSAGVLRQEIKRLSVAVHQHGFELPDLVDKLTNVVIAHFKGRNKNAPHEKGVDAFLPDLRGGKPYRLVPQARLSITKLPACPLRSLQSCRHADL